MEAFEFAASVLRNPLPKARVGQDALYLSSQLGWVRIKQNLYTVPKQSPSLRAIRDFPRDHGTAGSHALNNPARIAFEK